MKKIIIRTPNFIGDTINTTPCLELIKQEYPEAEFTIVGPDFVRELFKYDPRITHYITFPLKRKKKLSTYWKIVRELRKENGELGVIFVNTFISALLFRLGNVKKNIGYNREGRGFLLDFSPEINYHKHYINRYAFLFNEYIGNKYVYLPELSLRYTGQKTFQFDNSHKTIALYLGGENKEFRKYPDEYAVQLLRLLNRQGYNLLLIGDENDNIKHTQYAEEARIDHLIEKNVIKLHDGDLSDSSGLIRLVGEIRPDEIYNLAAQSHVQVSFDAPEYSGDVDALGVLRVLEAVRVCGLTKTCKVYQASTSELYGKVEEVPQKETTPFHPYSPYAVAKQYGFRKGKKSIEVWDLSGFEIDLTWTIS